MPVLKNPRHETFAQARAKGKTEDQAYIEAGYRPSRSAAARLCANVKVSARIAELTERTAIRAEIDIATVLRELARIGTIDPRRVFDENGQVKAPAEWDDDLAAAISSVEAVTTGEGEDARTTYKVRFWDKNAALDKIAKHFGMFIERQEINITHHIADLSDGELDAEITQAMAAEDRPTAH